MPDSPVLFDKPFPETQVRAPYKKYTNPILGTVFVTSGFMEPLGHGFKSFPSRAICRNGEMITVQPGNYNIGFDYTKGFGTKIITMYSGEVVKCGREGGYGHRIHVKLDIPFTYNGKSYECFQAYAHCSKLLKKVGQKVSQGEALAIEAGHGINGPNDYGSHVDLDTYCFMDGQKIHINFELLADNLDGTAVIQSLPLLAEGMEGEAVYWLRKRLALTSGTLPPGDVFDAETKEAVRAFQSQNPELDVDGLVGEQTGAALGLCGFAMFPTELTVIKAEPIQSSDISDPQQKFELSPGSKRVPLTATWVEDADSHWKFELQQSVFGRSNWFAFKSHVSIVKGYEEEIDLEELGDVTVETPEQEGDRRWMKALKACPTNGCLLATAQPEGLTEAGVASSHEIAKRDLKHLKPERLALMQAVANRLDVPVVLIAALASRESHIGTVLGKFGNDPGWGDNNHAWGILQVDRRFHDLKGLGDPYSKAHIRQAMRLFCTFRDQVALKHPSWPDEQVLKGACVAYNSGVSNVVTIDGMNQGTTHNDYGDDVIARAQFYLNSLEV